MFVKYLFEFLKDRFFIKREIVQVFCWVIEVEFDVINIYEQFVVGIEDEKIKYIFFDVVNEEKEYFGEFFVVFFEVDEELVKYMKEGFKEVEEEIGIKVKF